MSALLLECVFGHNTLEGTDILGNINRENGASSRCYPELSQVAHWEEQQSSGKSNEMPDDLRFQRSRIAPHRVICFTK
jgi:hypothetical protein